MSLQKNLMGHGLPGPLAQALGFSDEVTGLTATGTTVADALQLNGGVNQLSTCASNAGVILPSATGMAAVINNGVGTCLVYPGTAKQINNGTATTGTYGIAAGKTAMFVSAGASRWIATLST